MLITHRNKKLNLLGTRISLWKILLQVKSQLCSGVNYSTVAIVHCETSSGVMNDVEAVGDLVKLHQPMAHYFVDAMSSFGAVHLDLKNIDFVVSSANKCLQVPSAMQTNKKS